MSQKHRSPKPVRIRGRKGEGAVGQGQKSKEPKDWYHYCLYNCGYFLWPVCKLIIIVLLYYAYYTHFFPLLLMK